MKWEAFHNFKVRSVFIEKCFFSKDYFGNQVESKDVKFSVVTVKRIRKKLSSIRIRTNTSLINVQKMNLLVVLEMKIQIIDILNVNSS